MTSKDEEQETLKDKETTEPSAEDNAGKKQSPESEEAVEKNPDVEDPRLFSPLQEPDRPGTEERASDEKANTENTAG